MFDFKHFYIEIFREQNLPIINGFEGAGKCFSQMIYYFDLVCSLASCVLPPISLTQYILKSNQNIT